MPKREFLLRLKLFCSLALAVARCPPRLKEDELSSSNFAFTALLLASLFVCSLPEWKLDSFMFTKLVRINLPKKFLRPLFEAE